jgi:hypothetical protein
VSSLAAFVGQVEQLAFVVHACPEAFADACQDVSTLQYCLHGSLAEDQAHSDFGHRCNQVGTGSEDS